MDDRTWGYGLCSVLALIAGCGPAVVLERPQQWPAEWRGRQLYHTPNALIYAGSESAAGEADRAVASVAGRFTRDAGYMPEVGILIVTDKPDPAIPGDPDHYYREYRRQEWCWQHGTKPTEAQLDKAVGDSSKDEALRRGIVEDVFRVFTIQLSHEDLSGEDGFTDESISATPWVVAIPTERALADTMRKMMNAAMDEADVGPLARVAVAPLLLSFEPQMTRTMVIMRDVPIYAAFADAHDGWPIPEKRTRVHAFHDEQERKALGLLALFIKQQTGQDVHIPADTTSQPPPPESVPASAPSTTRPME